MRGRVSRQLPSPVHSHLRSRKNLAAGAFLPVSTKRPETHPTSTQRHNQSSATASTPRPNARQLSTICWSSAHRSGRMLPTNTRMVPKSPKRSLSRADTQKAPGACCVRSRSEEHTSELQSRLHLVCRLLLEKKKTTRKKR